VFAGRCGAGAPAAQTLRQQFDRTHGQAVGEQKAPRLLIGSEMTTVDGLKLVFLAKNREGYGNLSALITLAGGARRRRLHFAAPRPQRRVTNGAVPDCWCCGAE